MLQLTSEVWPQTLDAVRWCGEGRRNCVVSWLGPRRDSNVVDLVVHPQHTAEPWHYQIDDRWLTALFVRLAREQRSLRAQVHTHGGAAGHSKTDNDWPIIHTAGFLSIVLPAFGMRPLDPRRTYVAQLEPGGGWSSQALGDVVAET